MKSTQHEEYKAATIAQMDSNGRFWTVFERNDGSICVYWTRPGDPAQHVVYDTLDSSQP